MWFQTIDVRCCGMGGIRGRNRSSGISHTKDENAFALLRNSEVRSVRPVKSAFVSERFGERKKPSQHLPIRRMQQALNVFKKEPVGMCFRDCSQELRKHVPWVALNQTVLIAHPIAVL
jgi:hypothetical protein